jgi:hypothetical protein
VAGAGFRVSKSFIYKNALNFLQVIASPKGVAISFLLGIASSLRFSQ